MPWIKSAYVVALVVPLGSPVTSLAASPQENRLSAALVEWSVANCDTKKISGLVFSLTSMTVNGSSVNDMNVAREAVRKGVADNYTSTEAACADILPGLQAGTQ
ncbi:hypothetical protein GGQ73_003166 [Rhizobium skierniewicense]|uniref:Uncharacterized protein n=1 Tax=Rhizobium skierniewicense TaxID=984260 RepID=A0A7W6C7K2_9HYPH|nr:hypothetical protein [Rhizobium skierniewicense]